MALSERMQAHNANMPEQATGDMVRFLQEQNLIRAQERPTGNQNFRPPTGKDPMEGWSWFDRWRAGTAGGRKTEKQLEIEAKRRAEGEEAARRREANEAAKRERKASGSWGKTPGVTGGGWLDQGPGAMGDPGMAGDLNVATPGADGIYEFPDLQGMSALSDLAGNAGMAMGEMMGGASNDQALQNANRGEMGMEDLPPPDAAMNAPGMMGQVGLPGIPGVAGGGPPSGSRVGGTIQHGTVGGDPGPKEPLMVSPSSHEEFMGGSPELMMKEYYNDPIITPAGPMPGPMPPQTPPVIPAGPTQAPVATPDELSNMMLPHTPETSGQRQDRYGGYPNDEFGYPVPPSDAIDYEPKSALGPGGITGDRPYTPGAPLVPPAPLPKLQQLNQAAGTNPHQQEALNMFKPPAAPPQAPQAPQAPPVAPAAPIGPTGPVGQQGATGPAGMASPGMPPMGAGLDMNAPLMGVSAGPAPLSNLAASSGAMPRPSAMPSIQGPKTRAFRPVNRLF